MILSRTIATNYLIIRVFIGGGKCYKRRFLCICKGDNAIAICRHKSIHYPNIRFESTKLQKKQIQRITQSNFLLYNFLLYKLIPFDLTQTQYTPPHPNNPPIVAISTTVAIQLPPNPSLTTTYYKYRINIL